MKALSFACDYMEGAHPEILRRLTEINLEKNVGYGLDPYSQQARELIREACGRDDAQVHLLVGGTQTNTIIIDAMLRHNEGILAATS
ncbi:MAG: low specificity L-threonine aldolase, partial [Muribaculaceae bacterium]|nr:low specificity L-threonine aldolase [Muribaculaceae bacterium]